MHANDSLGQGVENVAGGEGAGLLNGTSTGNPRIYSLYVADTANLAMRVHHLGPYNTVFMDRDGPTPNRCVISISELILGSLAIKHSRNVRQICFIRVSVTRI